MVYVEFWMESKFKRNCMKQTMFFAKGDMTEQEINSQIEYCKKLLLKADNKIHVYDVKKEVIVEYTITGYTSKETRELVGRK